MIGKLLTIGAVGALVWKLLFTMSEADARDYICDSAQEFRAIGPVGVRPPTEEWVEATVDHLYKNDQPLYAICLGLMERCETAEHQASAIQVCVRGQFLDKDRICEEAGLLFEESPVPYNAQFRDRPRPSR